MSILVLIMAAAAAAASPPHVLFILCDDLGYDDLSLTGFGSQIVTPTLQKLASDGTVLSNYYVNAICTPTRTSFMTARYPIHVGLQHGVIADSVPEAIPINETLWPERMRQAGYRTHIVGKWHLGFHQKRFTPEARGFDTHFGYYTGNEEYWNHTSPCWSCGNYTALDLHRATATTFEPVTNESMHYSTELFTEELVKIVEAHPANVPLFLYAPYEAVHGASSCFREGKSPDCNRPDGDELQAPRSYIDAQGHIVNGDRRTFAGMLGALDDGIKNITESLQSKGMLSNTIILFSTDNGAPSSKFGGSAMSNWPLRGGKNQLWEGGVRATGFIWGAGVPKGKNITKLIHACDWFPTFVGLAGGGGLPATSDGYDVWKAITDDSTPSPRNEILHNIDPVMGAAAVRVGDFKLIIGEAIAGWGANPSDPDSKQVPGGSSKGPWMFNVRTDISERVNLYANPQFAVEQSKLESALRRYNRSAVPCRLCDATPDLAAAPKIVPGLRICTPAPVNGSDMSYGSRPSLCDDVGVWQPWQPDGAESGR